MNGNLNTGSGNGNGNGNSNTGSNNGNVNGNGNDGSNNGNNNGVGNVGSGNGNGNGNNNCGTKVGCLITLAWKLPCPVALSRTLPSRHATPFLLYPALLGVQIMSSGSILSMQAGCAGLRWRQV